MVGWSIDEALLLALLVFRMAGLMTFTPFFGATAIPVRIRIMFAFLLAWSVFGAMPRQPLPQNIGDFTLAIIGELAVGTAMGLVASILFAAVRFGGQIVDQQMGFSLTEAIDPMSDSGGTLTGQLHSYILILIFLFLDGHIRFLEVFLETVSQVPMGFVHPRMELISIFTDLMSAAFVFAIHFAAPVVAMLTLVNIALGFISRAVPAMNVLILGFPIKILMGIGLMMAILGQILSHTPNLVRSVIVGAQDVSNAMFQTDG